MNKRILVYTFLNGKYQFKVSIKQDTTHEELAVIHILNDFIEALWKTPVRVHDEEFVNYTEKQLKSLLPRNPRIWTKYGVRFDLVKNFISNYLIHKETLRNEPCRICKERAKNSRIQCRKETTKCH